MSAPYHSYSDAVIRRTARELGPQERPMGAEALIRMALAELDKRVEDEYDYGGFGPALRELQDDPVRVGSEREGWRARLANVERLLVEATALLSMVDARRQQRGKARLDEAIAEVRSMIDGDA